MIPQTQGPSPSDSMEVAEPMDVRGEGQDPTIQGGMDPHVDPSPTSPSASKSLPASDIDERLDLLGISIHWLSTGLVEEIRAAGLDEQSCCIHDLEDLSSESLGIARRKGSHIVSPVYGKMGASYVHCLSGNDNCRPCHSHAELYLVV